METVCEEIFDELLQYHRADWSMKQRYNRLYRLLDRVCKDLTRSFAAEYTSLFARLYALNTQSKYPHRVPIELFRVNAQKVRTNQYQPTEQDYLYDLKALCEFISYFYHTPLPAAIRALLPDGWRSYPQKESNGLTFKRLRFVVDSWDAYYIYGHTDEWTAQELQQVEYHISTDVFSELPKQLFPGVEINLLETGVSQAENVLTFHPKLIILEPDYLIDVSSLTACIETYGTTAANYLLRKLGPNVTTRHTLLGNAANQFLDDCVNETLAHPANWRESIVHNFRDYLLDYSVCDEVDQTYFKDSQVQFDHIRKTVHQKFGDATVDIDTHAAVLEPSFLCEALGIQGRMDLMLQDYSRIIELKSGKCEEFSGQHRGKDVHSLQMALYKEILYYNMNQKRDDVHTFLFYSRYPHLFEQRSTLTQIQQLMALRNSIVRLERQLRQGMGWNLLQKLTPESLNVNHTHGKLWQVWQKPQLRALLAPFHNVSPLEATYFNHFLQFVQKEQFLSKIGDDQPDSGRGFAETWRADLLTKQANGNILTNLSILHFEGENGVERIILHLAKYDENFLPNFREGDSVILYVRENDSDLATNQLIHRCQIEQLGTDKLTLKLNYKQRNPKVFQQDSLYALEHDHMDSSFNALYRGLYTFLQAPQERKDLLLCQREPRVDFSIPLEGRYTNEVINHLVQQAKQAQDYYLLVGPPGTGKTSVALKSMVQEFYRNPTCNLLLLSYTNRAVDEICKMLADIQPNPPYIRIGSELSCDPEFRPNLLKNKANDCTNRQQIQQLIRSHRIITGTVASLSTQMTALGGLKQFDVAIIDEASQILEPHLLGILSAQNSSCQCLVKKFILIGDHKQLPAVVVQRPEQSEVQDILLQQIGLTNCRNSLFERLYAWQLTHPTPNITGTLLKQGRMHPVVATYANQHFYHNALLPVPVSHQKEPLEFTRHGHDFQEFIATHRIGFLHCDYPQIEENNKTNREEAKIVAAIVGTVHALCLLNNMPFQAAQRIGIIVPFRGQIAMIRKELALLNLPETQQITIDTVERFQGSQRDIIIFNTVISQPYQLDILSAPVEIENQLVDRKLNVALTRARKQLFVVGNGHLLRRNTLYQELIDEFTTEI